jgi:methylenetetrahydrofolate reductase (NADPH)
MGAGNPFRHQLETGHFAVTAEVTPPRGATFDDLSRAAADLKPVISAINLTDGAGANVRLSSLAAAIHVKQLGIEPILQMTCRDRNRLAIQGDLLGAAAFGIANVLVLSGDRIDAGRNPGAKPVYDLDVRSLLGAMHALSNGTTLSGSVLDCRPTFFPGAADTAVEPASDWSPEGLMAKSAAGAKFVQMQYCFDIELLGRYVARLRDHGLTERLYFLVGLGPLRSAESAGWMRANLPGTVIPDGLIRRMAAARDPRHEGIAICAELMREAREMEGIAGVHLMAPGQHQAIVEAIRLSATL